MGRGSRQSQASGAKSLLYGPRRTGSGPEGVTVVKDPRITLQDDLLGHLEAIGYISDGNIEVDLGQETGDVRHVVFDIENPDNDQITRVITIEQDDSRSIAIYQLEDSDDDTWLKPRPHRLTGGETSPSDLDQLEDYLLKSADELGIDYVERKVGRQELYRRLSRGENIELALNEWNEAANSQDLRTKLIKMVYSYGSGPDGPEKSELISSLSHSPGNHGDFLKIVANNKSGSIMLGQKDNWRIRRRP